MDFQRILLTFFLVLCSTFLQANPAPIVNEGLAFIHGTRDHREDAYGNYWKVDFIDYIVQSLPNPENHFIVHCDFSHYMWHEDAANCVAEQLTQFISDKKISSLTLYTHSNGANIIRWIISNPTYDRRYLVLKNKIKQIIALAPSSGGTPLADEVINGGTIETNLGWLLDYTTDAVKQQRVGDMLIYNQELLLGSSGRPELPVPLNVIVGTDVSASPISSASYCNGYLLNAALKITKLYLDNCADGFLNCSSQLAAGKLWFYDVEKTETNIPLSHNQSRHSCFGLDQILINALNAKGIAQ